MARNFLNSRGFSLKIRIRPLKSSEIPYFPYQKEKVFCLISMISALTLTQGFGNSVGVSTAFSLWQLSSISHVRNYILLITYSCRFNGACSVHEWSGNFRHLNNVRFKMVCVLDFSSKYDTSYLFECAQ